MTAVSYTHLDVYKRQELESANGTEVAPAPEEFISPETDGAVNMDDPAV